MNIEPKNNFVLCEFVAWTDLTGSKIVMPGSNGDDITQKTGVLRVLKVGRGRYLDNGDIIPIDVRPGEEIVVFQWQQIHQLPPSTYGGKPLALVNADFIIGTVDRGGDLPLSIAPTVATVTSRAGRELLNA
jgi:co-chaperonin GroES (HSP10)